MWPAPRSSHLVIASVVVILTSPAKAGYDLRDVQTQEPQTPTFRTEANYVRVDIYPTANGAPVADLRQEDFEVLEDGVPQRVDAFERVVIRGPEPQAPRVEPNTVAESRAMLENPRARVFVLFLDLNHVDLAATKTIRQPLINFLNRAIGPDDLVGVMTPEMSGADVTFARKTQTIEGILTRYWWGERDRLTATDPLQELYKRCYPGFDDDRGVADEMIKRYRERETLTALENLVRYLRNLREERKAVIAITDGWLLYRPDASLGRPLGNQPDPRPRVGIDPNGRPVVSGQRGVLPYDDCERDRQRLAQLDSEPRLREIFDLANRANASFYPVDPRGLAVFDTSLGEPRTGLPAPGSTTMTPLTVDSSMLRARQTSLRDLALATDGLAIVATNDLEAGLRRVTADLSSYYLLAYYSTGKFDGRFHSISVRVKRPGVQVRARRGYLAPTPAEVAASANRTAPVAPADAARTAEGLAIEAVISLLSGFARNLPLRLQGAAGWTPSHAATIAVVGEIGAGEEWKAGADADIMLTTASGETLATARASIGPGIRGFRAVLASLQPLDPGDYRVRVRVRGRTPGSAPVNEAFGLTLPRLPDANGAVFIRRGPASGNRDAPTADPRFRRTEELRVEFPTPQAEPAAARLLDRNGKLLQVPVAVTLRDDPDGSRWQVARVVLAPLAAGDYVIEIAGAGGAAGAGPSGPGAAGRADGAGGETTRTLFAFRVIP